MLHSSRLTAINVKKLNSLKLLVRTTVAMSHNQNSKNQKGDITYQHIALESMCDMGKVGGTKKEGDFSFNFYYATACYV